jgi:hypothetical protein
MSLILGFVLFVISPLIGSAMWAAARIESPSLPVRYTLKTLSVVALLEAMLLLVEPFLRIAGSQNFPFEAIPLTAFNWLILIAPLVMVDFVAMRASWRLSRVDEIAELSDLDLARFDAFRARVRALGIAKLFYMGMVLGSVFGVFLILFAAGLPYFLTFTRTRRAEMFWWLGLSLRNRLDVSRELKTFADSRFGQSRAKLLAASEAIQNGAPIVESLVVNRLLNDGEAIELRVAQSADRLEEGLLSCAYRNSGESQADKTAIIANGSLMWLWAIASVTIWILGFLSYSIVPKYKAIMHDFGLELPKITQHLFRAGDDWAELGAVNLSLFVISSWIVLGSILLCVGWQNLNWSWIQQFFPRRDAPSILRNLGYLIRASWPVPRAIREVSDAAFREDLRERLNRVAAQVEAGIEFGEAMHHEGFVTRPEALALDAGQRAGQVDFAMQSLAESMDRLRLHRFRFLVEAAKPVFLIVIAMLVAIVCIAMFLPLISVMEALV